MELGKAVAQIMSGNGLAIEEVNRAALVSGPGSFTGLRIGMSYVKGLHAALGMDVVTMNSLELLASAVAKEGTPVCPMIDARKNEVYTALYEAAGMYGEGRGEAPLRVKETLSPRALHPQAQLEAITAEQTLFVGSGAVRYAHMIRNVLGSQARLADDSLALPSTARLCRIAEFLPPVRPEAMIDMEPLYIRSSGARLERLKKIRSDD
jgi:tRNA threonylcarbamoyladenosine biosynthesis protein TsaB